MTNENETPFEPFVPGPALLPEPGDTQPAPRQRRSRKAATPPAPPAAPAPNQRQRRPRKARTTPTRTPRLMKLPVDTMLSALSGLKGDDGALFEKLLGILNAAGKPQRSRVLTALGKVFS